jgi:DivIVA domain-containing protein
VSRVRRGYHCRQVETFLAQGELAATGARPQLLPDAVRRVGFELVRHGYRPESVDERLDQIEEQLLAAQETGGGRRGRRDPASDLEFLRGQLVSPYMQRFPRTGWLRRGYSLDDVDEFLDRVVGALSGDGTVTVEDVRRVACRPKRGGYDEGPVDETLDRVVEALLVLRRSGASAAGPTAPTQRSTSTFAAGPAGPVTPDQV